MRVVSLLFRIVWGDNIVVRCWRQCAHLEYWPLSRLHCKRDITSHDVTWHHTCSGEIIPEEHRSTIFALDRAFEGVVAAVAPAIVSCSNVRCHITQCSVFQSSLVSWGWRSHSARLWMGNVLVELSARYVIRDTHDMSICRYVDMSICRYVDMSFSIESSG